MPTAQSGQPSQVAGMAVKEKPQEKSDEPGVLELGKIGGAKIRFL